jgi:RHS repeat-associated protein
MVALRTITDGGSVLYYLHSDHLGSTSLTLDSSGAKLGEMKYTPYGETRYTWGSTPTDRLFTGQRAESNLGSLYDYNARFYSPAIGRFISADTIVPNPKSPQQFNRYAYTNNNPLKYIDPSGHFLQCYEIASMGQQCHDDGYSVSNPRFTSYDADERRAWLSDYANELRRWANERYITDLDALVEMSNFAASMIPRGMTGRTQAYANDMSYVLVASEGANALLGAFFCDHVPPNLVTVGFTKMTKMVKINSTTSGRT